MIKIVTLGCVLAGIILPAYAFAASADEATAALARATAAEAEAGKIRNQWSSTETELKAAQAAIAAKTYDEALAHAALAEAMARQSIVQAHEQETAWRDGIMK